MVAEVPLWSPAPDSPPWPGEGEVHIWSLRQDAPDRSARRGLLRGILSRYLGKAPDEIHFLRGPKGKPHLAPEIGLEFNHSDTRGVTLLAVCRNPVGLDVERADREVSALSLARRYFHPEEASLLEGLEDEALRSRFLAFWCAKEAVLKWTGEGLSGGLGRARIALLDGRPVTAEKDGRGLALLAFRPAEGHVAVLATEPGHSVKCWFSL